MAAGRSSKPGPRVRIVEGTDSAAAVVPLAQIALVPSTRQTAAVPAESAAAAGARSSWSAPCDATPLWGWPSSADGIGLLIAAGERTAQRWSRIVQWSQRCPAFRFHCWCFFDSERIRRVCSRRSLIQHSGTGRSAATMRRTAAWMTTECPGSFRSDEMDRNAFRVQQHGCMRGGWERRGSAASSLTRDEC